MSSGGGKSSTPTLISDNLKSKQFLRILDIISEGPIAGPIDQEHMSSFMLNNTSVTDSQGNASVNGVSIAWRPGSETQEPISGFDTVEATTIVNNEVTFDTPLVRTVTDSDVDRVRMNIGVSGLVEQDTKGNQKNTSVTMVIETRTGNNAFTPVKTVTITGKISGEYLEAHVIDAPDTKPFDIRLRRITPDSDSDLLNNGTVWNSYTEITDDNLSYPFTAVAGAVIDRDQYTDTPSRTYHLRGIIVDVPDNYDPITRTYTGLWTGGFKQAWTSNPAWILRALVKNTRYGMARRAGNIDVDDGSLYILSQYCDQEVDDGFGGKEPRMTLNAYITEQSSARDIIDKIAGMFRGMVLWDGMQLSVMLDSPRDPIAVITNANVVDGKFSYSSTKRSERYNAVVVSWTDPDNGWEQVKEYVSDDELIQRYDYNETTLEAFGCTSRGQAWRAGKWLLETAKRETAKVSFQMARDAIGFMPGDIVEVADNLRAATRLGGRIISHNGATITVDADVTELASGGDTMSVMGSDGKWVKHDIRSVSGRVITLSTAPTYVRDGTVFAISTSQVATRLFRIMSVAENDNNSTYTITAAFHDPNKQAVVDEGAVFEIPNDTLNGYRVPNIENLKIINTNTETVQVTATWETATTTRKLMFELYVYTEDGRVVAQYETEQFRYDFYGLDAGSYTLGVRGRNENGMKGAETQVSLVIGAPSAPSNIIWTPGLFSADIVPVMRVTATTDTSFEFWYSGTTQITDPGMIEDNTQFLGRSTQWTLHGLKADTTYYVYVRTKNAFGVSEFVEASGKASADIPGMIDLIDDAVRDSDAFKNIQEGVDTNLEGIMQNAQANHGTVEHQWAQYGEVRADILVVKTTVADAEKGLADLSTYVQAQIGPEGELTAAVNEKLTAEVTSEGTAKASYTLNLGIVRSGVKYNTGFGMSIEPDGSSYKSTVVFAADQFGIYSGSDPGNYEAAFFVYNGQVFMNSAFIRDGSIDNAKIGNYIQSNNYVSGNSGWNIDKNGTIEINGSNGSGRKVITATLEVIYDANGTMRMRSGLW
jgi:predicted phage tail protein